MRRLAALATAIVIGSAAVSPAADEFVVIVHPSVAGANVRRGDLASVFLKKATRWGDRSLAVPVDQSGTSPVRKAFSEAVLGMSPTAAVQYWQKQMLSSSPLRPPTVKSSDAEVIAFVGRTEGAVGYVSRETALPPEVKAVALID
jgi:ABC-type phosphate transport system substrate-binding protein